MFGKIIKKPLKIIWAGKNFYLPFMIGTLLAFSTLISVALFVKLSIHIVERLELQFLLLHPMKNITISSLKSFDKSNHLLARQLLDPKYKSKNLH
jgi:hypothetical protein